MALTTSPGRWWSRVHFLVRFAGLTGLLVAGVGFLLASPFIQWSAVDLSSWDYIVSAGKAAWEHFLGETGPEPLPLALRLIVAGLVAALLALIFEAVAALRQVAGRRSAVGLNAAVQIGLAAALLVGVNVHSFRHYLRFDWTRDGQFTLPTDVRERLAQLDGPTTIVLYQAHVGLGQLGDKPDNYDSAAERQVVEKVQDLADQFREQGAQVKVVILDVQDQDYPTALARLKESSPALYAAIERAPESTILVAAGGKVQQLAFREVYQLEKRASQEANDGRGNLVLRYQGVEPLAHKVLGVDEKRPRVAVGAMHEALGLEGMDAWGMRAVRKALTARGFDTRDLILKEGRAGEPAVLTYDESKHERLEVELEELDKTIDGDQKELDRRREALRLWEGDLGELNRKYALIVTPQRSLLLDRKSAPEVAAELRDSAPEPHPDIRVEDLTDDFRKKIIKDRLEPTVKDQEDRLKQEQDDREAMKKEQKALNVDNLTEQRRISDLQAKMNRMLADCDLLILPRMTLLNASRRQRLVEADFYALDAAQLHAVREFLKAGKPVLFCLGPTNEPLDPITNLFAQLGVKSDRMEGLLAELAARPNDLEEILTRELKLPPGQLGFMLQQSRIPLFQLKERVRALLAQRDSLEDLLAEMGIKLGKQTVLFNAEGKAYAARRTDSPMLDTPIQLPSVAFDWPRGAGRPLTRAVITERRPNPLRESLRLTVGSLGKDQPLDLRITNPRPVYFEPGKASDKSDFESEFMMTSPASWNEGRPFQTRDYTPRYEPPRPGDVTVGTLDEKRTGPFPIGVAVEVKPWAANDDYLQSGALVGLPGIAPGAGLAWAASAATAKPATDRVVVIGHGGVFMGPTLSPIKEKLLLDTCNWLLRRDDLLTKPGHVWEYPRVPLSEEAQSLWAWSTRLGMPGLFIYLGLVVLMVRRLR
jgi:hypothetical protein